MKEITKSMKKYIIITTINPKSRAIESFEQKKDWHIVIVGDKKSKFIGSSENLTFLSMKDQQNLGFKLAKVCPFNHYTRKNMGYLYAIQNGADIIFDTDDDNFPYDDWETPTFTGEYSLVSENIFINIFRYFSNEQIWPRGFPLDEINKEKQHELKITKNKKLEIGLWQGMTDIDPDVDAIFRILHSNKKIMFQNKKGVFLQKGFYCPTNSQNTFWNKKAFPYLYLPATVSFRFTDILRGYIAQRLMWEQNLHTGFSKSTVFQERNVHDLINDFKDEVECYLNIKPIVYILDRLDLESEPMEAIKKVYRVLQKKGFVKKVELSILDAWIQDFSNLSRTHKEV